MVASCIQPETPPKHHASPPSPDTRPSPQALPPQAGTHLNPHTKRWRFLRLESFAEGILGILLFSCPIEPKAGWTNDCLPPQPTHLLRRPSMHPTHARPSLLVLLLLLTVPNKNGYWPTTSPSWGKQFHTYPLTHANTHTPHLYPSWGGFPGWEAGHRYDDPAESSMDFPLVFNFCLKVPRSITRKPPSQAHSQHSPAALKNRSWDRG